jgi:hypothetical protein
MDSICQSSELEVNGLLLKKKRKQFVDHIKKHLTGSGVDEQLLPGEKPLDRFVTGFLFPIFETEEGLDELEPEEDGTGESEDDVSKAISDSNLPKRRRYLPPSSVGFSFFISGENIRLRVFHRATYYKRNDKERNPDGTYKADSYTKNKLAGDGEEIEFFPNGQKQYVVFDGKARIEVLWRILGDGYIVTLSLSNNQKIYDTDNNRDFIREQNEKTLFEVNFRCIIESGKIGVYPLKNKSLLNEEEKEIELRYKDQNTYAVGHGAAADWELNEEDKMEIKADFMPMVEVPQVTADIGGEDSKVLEFEFLRQKTIDGVIMHLELFIQNYETWIESQIKDSAQELDEDKSIANNIVTKQQTARERMQSGIDLIKSDPHSREAFSIMNEVMLMQWESSDRYSPKEKSEYKWRPFQLAFILMLLESVTSEDSEFRDTVDLIWFPTGGGKTEAYLGIMVFLFVYRRLRYPASSGGTTAIMRYTLRLLTTQQFLRANKVVFALELIRRKNSKELGDNPFTSGLWVGRSLSPNTFSQTMAVMKNDQFSKLILTHCPWCNSKFNTDNYYIAEDSFHFRCVNNQCEFGSSVNNILPCSVVDEALYAKPPTLLIATVDKFARLAWEDKAGSFFGVNGNRPPELIIQDELHLISSALGSIVGLYEAGIDTALIARRMRAKYIASTATIKNAKEQVKSLFGRKMLVFPPSGLRDNDSHFAKTVPLNEKPGRLYVGYLAPLLSKQNCLAPLAASLLTSPIKLFKDEEELMDCWWTHIVYHGSLKGVNSSRTLYQSEINNQMTRQILCYLRDEIEEAKPGYTDDGRLHTIDDYLRIEKPEEIKAIVDKYLPVRELGVKILTSHQTAEENANVFSLLSRRYNEPESVDAALATNMISVGLDVSRLALMVINGQPLTTAEYIQASSRVGRSTIPGVVFVNYYKTQARSLSHYENFRSYHQAFYRYVEPSSLTPFTYQARRRALHAALIIAVRHSDTGMLDNESAGHLDINRPETISILKEFKLRCKKAINNLKTDLSNGQDIDDLISAWLSEINYCSENRRKLVYFSTDKASNNLICNFDEENGLWPTLNSMRNVENTALMRMLGGIRLNEEA